MGVRLFSYLISRRIKQIFDSVNDNLETSINMSRSHSTLIESHAKEEKELKSSFLWVIYIAVVNLVFIFFTVVKLHINKL